MQDAVGPRELADLVEQPGGVDDVLLCLVAAELDRQSLRVAGDRGGVAAGRLVAHAERPHERSEHAELQPDELDRARFQLLGAVLGAQQRDRQVLEDQEQHDRGEQHRQADARIGDREDRRERACRELCREQREELAHLARERSAFLDAHVQPDQDEVEPDEHDEGAEDDQAEDDALRQM